MVLPDKYTSLESSLLYCGALILKALGSKSLTIERVWNKFSRLFKGASYEKFIDSLLVIYMLGYVECNDKGEIFNENFNA